MTTATIQTNTRNPAPVKARQICFFAAFMLPMTKLLEAPSNLSKEALGDLLLPALLHFLFQAGVIFGLLLFISKTDGGLFPFLERKIGKTGLKIFKWCLAVYFLFSVLQPLLDLEKFVHAAFYDTEPNTFSLTPFFFLSGYICVKSLKSFGRIADLCTPVFLIAFIGLILMSLGVTDFEAILPWFEFPISKIATATTRTTVYFSDAILLLPLLGDFDYKKGDSGKIFSAYGVGGLFTLLFLAVFYGIYGSLAPIEHYAFTKIAQYFPALQTLGRIDLLLVYALTAVLLYVYSLPIAYACRFISDGVGGKPVITSAVINTGLLLFTFFGNRHYNFFHNLFTQKLWWIFPLFILALLLFCLLLILVPIGTKEKSYEK